MGLPSKYITSPQNPFFIRLKHILSGRGVKKFEQTAVFGKKLVEEFLQKYPQKVATIVFAPSHEKRILSVSMRRFALCCLGGNLFREVDIFNTNHPFIVTSVPPLKSFDLKGELPPGCTLLLPFQNPENVGAVIRSCVAFGVSSIVVLKEAANPFHPKSIRSSSGAVFEASISKGPSIKDIAPHPYLVSLNMNGGDIRNFHFPERFLLLPGLEGLGVPSHLKCQAIRIPFSGNIDSLNAAVATSIAIYEWFKSTIPAEE